MEVCGGGSGQRVVEGEIILSSKAFVSGIKTLVEVPVQIHGISRHEEYFIKVREEQWNNS